jgi:hypothetical protein
MARFRKIALLADEVDAGSDAVEMTDEAIGAAVADPAGPVADVADSSAQMEADNEEIAETAESAEALDQVGDTLEQAVENGEGIPPVAAEAIRILASRIGARHGLQVGGLNIASESFKSKTGRVQATRIAMESVKQWAKDLWKMIVKAYEKTIEWFKKWWNKFFDAATKLKDRAEEIEKAAKSKASNPKPYTRGIMVEVGEWGTHLQSAKGDMTPQVIVSTTSNLITRYEDWVNKLTAAVTASLTALPALMEAPNNFDSLIKPVLPKIGVGSVMKNADGELPDGMEVTGERFLFGGKMLYVKMFSSTASSEDIKDNIGSMKIWIDEVNGFRDTAMVEFEPVQMEDIKVIAGGVKALAVKLIDNKNDASKLEANVKKIKDRAAKLASKAEEDDDGDNIRAAGAAARAMLSMSSSGMSQIRSLFLTTGNALLSFCQASLALVGKKKDSEKK